MTVIEILLLIIGCVFMIASFFVSEKLSAKEIDRIAELSDTELKSIVKKGMESASVKIDEVVQKKVEEASEKVEIAMERESNLKIMAIEDYSDTVIDSIKKTHEENMFLYSMLNDKHTELTSLTGNLQRLAANVRNLQETIPSQEERPKPTVFYSQNTEEEMGVNEMHLALMEEKVQEQKIIPAEHYFERHSEESFEKESNNDRILALYKQGFDKVEIARKLSLGVGEVSLVIGLYRGEE